MLKIYGHPMSTCTRKVLMTLAENETPYEMEVVDLGSGMNKQPAHLARQPFGRIPTIDDDGYKLFESRAICRYIDRKVGGKLVPTDPKMLGVVEQWISIETSEFSSHAMKFIYEYFFKRPQGEAVLDAAGKALTTTATLMNETLAKKPFLTGDSLTLADICFMPYLEYAMGTPAKELFAPHANLVAWWNRLRGRPTWQKINAKP